MTAMTAHERPSVLVTLQELDRWVDSGDEPLRILTNIACLIGNRLECNACSIYRLDRLRQTVILAATVGLRQDCVGKIRMKLGQGLTGLVAEEKKPVEIAADASAHPCFKYFPEAGEEPYESFLGVPIIDGSSVEGVLVVQTIEPHQFTPEEVRMLGVAGRTLGPLLSRLPREPDLEPVP